MSTAAGRGGSHDEKPLEGWVIEELISLLQGIRGHPYEEGHCIHIHASVRASAMTKILEPLVTEALQ
jgi:hypothetical protein